MYHIFFLNINIMCHNKKALNISKQSLRGLGFWSFLDTKILHFTPQKTKNFLPPKQTFFGCDFGGKTPLALGKNVAKWLNDCKLKITIKVIQNDSKYGKISELVAIIASLWWKTEKKRSPPGKEIQDSNAKGVGKQFNF